MRATDITQKEVDEIADALVKNGEKASSRAVLAALGRGSMATVVKFLGVWRQSKGATVDSLESKEIDGEVARAINTYIGRRVADATSAANGRAAEYKADLESVMQESEQQVAEIDRLTSALEKANATIQDQAGRIDELKEAAARLKSETDAAIEKAVAETKRETAARETAQVALAKAELRLESMPRMKQELDQLRQEMATIRVQVAEADKRAAVSEARLQSAEQQVKAHETREADAKAQLKALEAEFARVKTELQDAKIEAASRGRDSSKNS